MPCTRVTAAEGRIYSDDKSNIYPPPAQIFLLLIKTKSGRPARFEQEIHNLCTPTNTLPSIHMKTAEQIILAMRAAADDSRRQVLERFFKTGPGEYGEGDRFLGLPVPLTRAFVKKIGTDISFEEIEILADSPWHEVRLAAFLLLVEQMKAATPSPKRSPLMYAARRSEIAEFYLRIARKANNWDLVDLACYKVLGSYLTQPDASGKMPDNTILDRLAASTDLWEQRIAIVSTLAFIRKGDTSVTMRIADLLLPHPHDLIHKAVGWMLREAGKRNPAALDAYLEANSAKMHRTALRYAIERLPEAERKAWLAR